jgi:hypothetical protein
MSQQVGRRLLSKADDFTFEFKPTSVEVFFQSVLRHKAQVVVRRDPSRQDFLAFNTASAYAPSKAMSFKKRTVSKKNSRVKAAGESDEVSTTLRPLERIFHY